MKIRKNSKKLNKLMKHIILVKIKNKKQENQ